MAAKDTERVYFPPPVTETIKAPTAANDDDESSTMPSYIKAEDEIKACIHEGFGVGAVVTKRNKDRFHVKSPFNFGVVVYHNQFIRKDKESDYKPLGVKWVGSDAPADTLNMDDLYLIYAHYDDTEFDTILDSQDP